VIFPPRFSSKGKAALIFLKDGANARTPKRQIAGTVHLYSRIVERLVAAIKGCTAEGWPRDGYPKSATAAVKQAPNERRGQRHCQENRNKHFGHVTMLTGRTYVETSSDDRSVGDNDQ
jgi:hypothetical protein